MGIRAGSCLLELERGASVIYTRRGFTRVDGLPFPALHRLFCATSDGERAALNRALRRLAGAQEAESIAATLASQDLLARAKTLMHEAQDIRRTLGGRATVRVGALRRVDLRGGGPLVHVAPAGWRVSGEGACLECAMLWEVQSNRSPRSAASLANARPRRCAIALAPGDVARIARALDARPENSRWLCGVYGRDVTSLRAQRVAAGCSRCRARPAHVRRACPQAARAADRAIHRLGIARREKVLRSAGGAAPIVQVAWGVAFLHSGRTPEVRAQLNVQLGVGPDQAQRTLVGRAETIERASALLHEPDVRATRARALRHPYLPLAHWALYTPRQYGLAGFPFRPVDEDTPLDWTWAEDAATGERLLVPTAFTMTERLTTARFVEGSSNGVATHVTREEALRSALLEVIERDALQRAWYCGRGARPLDGRAVHLSTDQRAFFESAGWSLRFACIPGRARLCVVAAIAIRSLDSPTFARGGALLGAAAAGDLDAAVARAAREVRMAIEGIGDGDARTREALAAAPRLETYWAVEDLMDITHLYLRPQMRPALDVLLGGRSIRGPRGRVPDDACSIVKRLGRDGLRTLVIDLSQPRTAPFVTLQALVLGTQPLAFGPGVLRLGSNLLPRRLPPRSPPPPPPRFRVRAGALNPYILPLA